MMPRAPGFTKRQTHPAAWLVRLLELLIDALTDWRGGMYALNSHTGGGEEQGVLPVPPLLWPANGQWP
jgi:hypothetical protein